jgi:hypothetical protein
MLRSSFHHLERCFTCSAKHIQWADATSVHWLEQSEQYTGHRFDWTRTFSRFLHGMTLAFLYCSSRKERWSCEQSGLVSVCSRWGFSDPFSWWVVIPHSRSVKRRRSLCIPLLHPGTRIIRRRSFIILCPSRHRLSLKNPKIRRIGILGARGISGLLRHPQPRHQQLAEQGILRHHRPKKSPDPDQYGTGNPRGRSS